MAGYSGPNVNDDGLVLSLSGASTKSFKGEATTNYYSTPITLTSGRTGSTDGSIKTSFNTGGPTGGPFTRVVRDTSVSRTTDWEWQIGYSGTGLSNGNSFVVSFYARCPNGTLSSVKLSNPDVEGQTFNIDSTWRRFTASFTYGAQGGLTFFRVNRGHSPFYTNGATYDIANLQVEAKSYSTSFVDGTRGTTVATGGGWKNRVGSSDGELVNGVKESDDGGGSLVFDGTNDYVPINYDLSWTSSSSASISLWIKPNSLSSSYYPFMGKTNWEWQLMQKNTSLQFVCWNTSGGHTNGPRPEITNFFTSVNDFVNLSLVWNHSDNKYYFYRNGILVNTTTWTNSSINQNRTEGIKIGGNIYQWSTSGRYWTGKISNVQIYNRSLSESEVKRNFIAFRRRFGL